MRMNNLFNQLKNPAIFAHRGASLCAPENTLAAFNLALHQGADGIELDAKLTSDGHVVVIHDQTVDRTTQGHGKVGELTLSQIRKLDAGSFFDIAFKGEPVPTLEEVFKAVGQLAFINIELTNYASIRDDLPEKVANLIIRYRLQQRVYFSSFNPIALIRARRALPEIPIGFLSLPGRNGWLARSWFGRLLSYDCLHPEFSDVTQKMVKNLHHRKKRIYVYTVNDRETMQKLYSYKVDGIITDDPILARQVLTSQFQQEKNKIR